MKYILILMLSGGGQVESGVVYPTLAECEAAGQRGSGAVDAARATSAEDVF